MLSTLRTSGDGRRLFLAATAAIVLFAGSVSAARGQAGSPKPPGTTGSEVPAGATVESLFVDFLHYARLGRFTTADAFAKALLTHPDLDPALIFELSEKDKKSVDTLLILIKNSSIGDNANRVLDLIHKGRYEKARSADRVVTNIRNLAGSPQQEFFARQNLAEAGEYSVPLMLETLLDPAKSDLWPGVINTFASIGKPAVNPLVIALAVRNNDVRLHLIHALGEIGYPQAIPYLSKYAKDQAQPEATRIAAGRAIQRIETITGRTFPGTTADLFFQLADKYYNGDDTVRADPRLEEANIWYWDESGQALKRLVLPQRIFGPVMAMRCCEEALRLRNDQAEAIALWLAANIRREHRLGMDTESGDPEEKGELDPTRPEVFPRALYFTQAAGPRYAHMVLDRAVRDQDSAVSLGAIEALRVTAGEASLIGTEDYKQPLAQALHFPDPVVRIRAALVLGAALPKSQFAGSELVVPVLAFAVTQNGREQVLVVDPDESNLNRVMGALRSGDRDVMGDTGFFRGLEGSQAEFRVLTGIFVASDSSQPGLPEALRRLRSQFIYSKTPVVVLTKPRDQALVRELTMGDAYVEPVDAALDAIALQGAFERVRARTSQAPFDPDLALSVSLQAVETLRQVAVDGRTVYDLRPAEPALIAALSSPEERLQTLAASVLALLGTPTAQRAVAHLALRDENTTSLRLAAFASLSESAKNSGNLLEESQLERLVWIARNETDLIMRTAASQALGAINLSTSKASEIIRGYYGG